MELLPFIDSPRSVLEPLEGLEGSVNGAATGSHAQNDTSFVEKRARVLSPGRPPMSPRRFSDFVSPRSRPHDLFLPASLTRVVPTRPFTDPNKSAIDPLEGLEEDGARNGFVESFAQRRHYFLSPGSRPSPINFCSPRASSKPLHNFTAFQHRLFDNLGISPIQRMHNHRHSPPFLSSAVVDDPFFSRAALHSESPSSFSRPSSSSFFSSQPPLGFFPSDARSPRSHSLDTRRQPFLSPASFDSYPDHLPDFPSAHRRPSLPLSREELSPSPIRVLGQQGVQQGPTQTSTALLSLLQRYPSARKSILGRSYLAAAASADVPGSSDSGAASNSPSHSSLNSNLSYNNYADCYPPPESSLSSSSFLSESATYNSEDYDPTSQQSFYSSYYGRPVPSDRINQEQCYPGHVGLSSYSAEHSSIPIRSTSSSTLRPAPSVASSLDVSVLDELLSLDSGISQDPQMSRSTSEWRSSFAKAQKAFSSREGQGDPSHLQDGYTTNGRDSTMERRTMERSDDGMEGGLLASALERRASESPFRRPSPTPASSAIGSFWSRTLATSHRAASPTPARLPSSLSAAERLQELAAESASSPSSSSATLPRRFRESSIASRQAAYLDAAQTNSQAAPNFASLDGAVAELSNSVRSGCRRFPTNDEEVLHFTAVSAARRVPVSSPFRHSPSPESLGSECSSYGIPNGLPHPKPRHNVREQLAATCTFVARPNFPSTGSVATRISELEKRPGTPTLQVTGGQNGGRECTREPPLSPRSTVFRAKPVIHVDVGGGRHLGNFSSANFASFASNYSTPSGVSNGVAKNAPPETNGTPVTNIASRLAQLRLEDSESPCNAPFTTSTPIKCAASPGKVKNVVDGISSVRVRLDLDSSSSSSGDSTFDLSSNGLTDKALANGLISRAVRGLNVSAQMEEEKNGVWADGDSPFTPTRRPPSHASPLLRRVQQEKPRLINYERFYFPQGKPVSATENDAALRRASEVFRQLPDSSATLENMPAIVRSFGLPLYWKRPVWDAVSRGKHRVEHKDFSAWWRALTTLAHDEAARFIHIMTRGTRSYLVMGDLDNFILDIIHSHPGLNFYRKSEEFHDKFIQVISTRIFWTVNRSWSGRINCTELRRSHLLQSIRELETTEEINQMTEFFSYEHFYVVYCKFWEIDTDHDLLISREDLARHGGEALPPLVIDRIFSSAVTRGEGKHRSTRNLSDFTAFLLADEDKRHPTSIEYWFRIMDLDGDGVISLYDMELFYNQIKTMMEEKGIETMKFNDIVCNLIDMIGPSSKSGFTLSDLRRSPLAPRFFNSFVNWRKFYTQETVEGERASVRGNGEEEISDWDRFCMEEYEALMEQDEDVDENISVNLDEGDLLNVNGKIVLEELNEMM